MKTKIKAEVVADSLSPQGDRLTSLLITFPRIILAEINTHRMLSKNTSSSRAIPFNKMVEAIESDPFIPIAWQKEHKGMQGNEYFTEPLHIEGLIETWLDARDNAVELATDLNENGGVTKQLCNRLLEPFMWTTMLVTGSKEGWENFFELRCPQYIQQGKIYKSKKEAINKAHSKLSDKRGLPTTDLDWLRVNKGQAEIHMMALAEAIYDAMNESTPKQLKAGEWHIPMVDKITFVGNIVESIDVNNTHWQDYDTQNKVKISTAMAARTSYTAVGDEKEMDYQRMIALHDRLIAQNPPHSSPMEHCARAMSDEEYISFIKGEVETGWFDESEHQIFLSRSDHYFGKYKELGWCRNFKGFIQYRHIVENYESVLDDYFRNIVYKAEDVVDYVRLSNKMKKELEK